MPPEVLEMDLDQSDESSDDQDEVDEGQVAISQQLKELLGSTCKLYHIGKVDTTKFTESPDKSAKKITRAIEENLPNHEARYEYACKFETLSMIETGGVFDSLFIEIHRISRQSRRTDQLAKVKRHVSFEGLFICPDPEVNQDDGTAPHPLFICSTSEKMWRIIAPELTNIFLCAFVPYRFTSSNMLYMTGKLMMVTGLKKGDQLKVNFSQLTNENLGTDWEASIDLGVWEEIIRLVNTNGNDADDEVLHALWNPILEYLKKSNGVKFNVTELRKIYFRRFVISSAGKIKAGGKDAQEAISILENLTRLSEPLKSTKLREERLRLRHS